VIFGIDASTVATGYAHGGPQDAVPRGGVWKLPGCDELGGKFDVTLKRVGQSLMENAKLLKPRAIYIEAPLDLIDRRHSAATAAALMQMAGALRMAIALVDARVELCAIHNVRKTFGVNPFLLSEQAKKAVMARCDELGWSYQDDNEADAKATWHYGMKQEYPGWVPNQRQLFNSSTIQGGK
jgi:hypothetical protein